MERLGRIGISRLTGSRKADQGLSKEEYAALVSYFKDGKTSRAHASSATIKDIISAHKEAAQKPARKPVKAPPMP